MAEAELRKRASIFQNTQVGIVIGDGESKSFEFNNALAAIHGYAITELKDKPISELIVQDERAPFATGEVLCLVEAEGGEPPGGPEETALAPPKLP